MNVTILAPDGSMMPNNGSNGISILAPDGSLMLNNGSNGISYLKADGSLRENDGTLPVYSIFDANGSLNPYNPAYSYSVLDLDGSVAEGDRINFLNHSNNFKANPPWNNTSILVEPNATTGPEGVKNASRLTVTADSVGARLTQNVTLPWAGQTTYSLYLKADASNTVTLILRNNTTASNLVQLTANLFGAGQTGPGWTSTPVGDGWYRFVLTHASFSLNDVAISYIYPKGSASLTNDSVFAANTQLQAGPVTEYERTTT